ncbi:MAG: response regulator [Chloroflexi bacterium]|nr:response regulator [Chloroflexota bacterium]
MTAAEPLILVVDDNEMNRDMLSRRLERQGYRALVAEDGAQALELVAAHDFDLVLLDIMMPRLNGYQVLEHIKSDERLRHIPVIMISAVDDLDSVVKCIEMGAEDYLFKPFNPILLKARINASLEKKRLRDREQQLLAGGLLPAPVAERARRGERVTDTFPEATALVARVGGLNNLAPETAADVLNDLFDTFHALAAQYGVYGIESPGGVYVAVSGAPVPQEHHARQISTLAREMRDGAQEKAGITLHIGIHTGPVQGAVLTSSALPRYIVWGEAITGADELCHTAPAGTIQISPEASELLGQS